MISERRETGVAAFGGDSTCLSGPPLSNNRSYFSVIE